MTEFNDGDRIREWLIQRLCVALNVPSAEVDPDAPFSRYGLDSIGSVTLVMDLEDHLKVELAPTLLWDYPTVNKCVSYLISACPGAKNLEFGAS